MLSMVAVAAWSRQPPGPASSLAATPTITIGGSATAQVYAWGAATMTDGSVLFGDYWNLRIVHYNANGTPGDAVRLRRARPGSARGPTRRRSASVSTPPTGPDAGDVYMTEGSLYNVNMYSPTGTFITSWGNNKAVHLCNFDYPSQCAVNPVNEEALHLQSVGQEHGHPRPGQPQRAGAVHLPGRAEHLHPATRASPSTAPGTSGSPTRDITASTSTTTVSPCTKPTKTILPPGGVSTHLRHARPGHRHHATTSPS